MEVGGAVRVVMAIDWRDRKGGWTEFMRIRIKLDNSKPLRWVVCVVDSDGADLTCVIKYEWLLVFCYICGNIGYSTKKCSLFSVTLEPKDL